MIRVIGKQLRKSSGYVRAEVRRAPVEVTYRGRPELVVLSVEDYALLRQSRKLAMTLDDMPVRMIERIAGNRMDGEHAGLDRLMDG